MRLLLGDCLEVLTTLEADSVDSLITDPPGGIKFMGKEWDSDKGGRDQWIAWLTAVLSECYRVLKPGAMALVWAIPRTSHWTGTAIENAGFEIRDQIFHLFGSGFPKSHDISKAIDRAAGAKREVIGTREQQGNGGYQKQSPHFQSSGKAIDGRSTELIEKRLSQPFAITAPATEAAKTWQGYGTALKPAAEIWWLAMKPIQGTFAANALEHGVAGLWIEGCRVPTDWSTERGEAWLRSGNQATPDNWQGPSHKRKDSTIADRVSNLGRWPANVIHDGSPEVLAEFARYGERKSGGSAGHRKMENTMWRGLGEMTFDDSIPKSTGTAARFFYCAKASKSERTNGGKVDNNHPTVKPLALCRYLARLTKTPAGGVVLDPFMGSGSIGIAALLEGRDFIGIEKDEGNYQTAVKRIEDWQERVQRHGVQMEIDG